MFLRDLLQSIFIIAIICSPMVMPDNNPHGPPWWLAAALTVFWGLFGAMVVAPAAREHVRGWDHRE